MAGWMKVSKTTLQTWNQCNMRLGSMTVSASRSKAAIYHHWIVRFFGAEKYYSMLGYFHNLNRGCVNRELPVYSWILNALMQNPEGRVSFWRIRNKLFSLAMHGIHVPPQTWNKRNALLAENPSLGTSTVWKYTDLSYNNNVITSGNE